MPFLKLRHCAAIVSFASLLWAMSPPVSAAAFDLPPIDRIVNYQPKLPLQVFTSDGVEIAQFGAERREFVPLAKTPKMLQDAVLAIEDTRFREHSGVDPKGMARAAVAMLTGGRKQGASTITQQLVRTMLLTRAFTAERKTKEILLAFKVEDALSKDRILEIYLNEIFLGQRAYGFAAAARTYFGKTMDELSTAEIAMLAGLPQNPYYANPMANMERAMKRQRLVLGRMRATGVINDQQLATATAEQVTLRPRGTDTVPAAHVAEMARRLVVERFGTEAYSNGLRVVTSLVSTDQRAAHDAVQRGVLAFDRRGAWRGPEGRTELPEVDNPELASAAAQALKEHPDDERLRVGIVLSANPKAVEVQLADGERISVTGDGLQWAKAGLSSKAKPALKIDRGAVVRVVNQSSTARDKTGRASAAKWSLTQWPEVEAALAAMDTQTGRVRALVGGYDFNRQPFNHVTQGWRQPGSAFKPFLYSAALEQRVMPTTLVDDLPFTAANGWSPDNSHGAGVGPITLREALTSSSNLASVRVLQHVGVPRTRDWTERFGLDASKQPNDLTLSLGTGSTTPLQMARAYATFANGGWSVAPVVLEKITDAQGQVLFEADPVAPLDENNRAISARNAFVMGTLLNDVTRTGTAAKAQAQLNRSDVYGKTGTTNDVVDAWFAGYHPTLSTAVWVGYDKPRSLGDRESGSRAALPIWIDYMRVALKNTAQKSQAGPPPGLVNAGGDWFYSEWVAGGWVTQISDTQGVVYAQPPAADPPAGDASVPRDSAIGSLLGRLFGDR